MENKNTTLQVALGILLAFVLMAVFSVVGCLTCTTCAVATSKANKTTQQEKKIISEIVPTKQTDQQVQENIGIKKIRHPSEIPTLVLAEKLLSEYEENEVKADSLYRDDYVESFGVIKNIGKDLLDEQYVTIGTGKNFELSSIRCVVASDSKSDLLNLKKGQSISVNGKVSEYLIDVFLRDCRINTFSKRNIKYSEFLPQVKKITENDGNVWVIGQLDKTKLLSVICLNDQSFSNLKSSMVQEKRNLYISDISHCVVSYENPPLSSENEKLVIQALDKM